MFVVFVCVLVCLLPVGGWGAYLNLLCPLPPSATRTASHTARQYPITLTVHQHLSPLFLLLPPHHRYDVDAVSTQVDDFCRDLSTSLDVLKTCGQLQYLLTFGERGVIV